MMSVLEADSEVPDTATSTPSRYRVAVHIGDGDLPLIFDVGSPTLANEAVEWCRADTRVTRIEVIDLLDGQTIRTWIA